MINENEIGEAYAKLLEIKVFLLGALAFRNGLKPVAINDAELVSWLVGVTTEQRLRLLLVWHRGWSTENMRKSLLTTKIA